MKKTKKIVLLITVLTILVSSAIMLFINHNLIIKEEIKRNETRAGGSVFMTMAYVFEGKYYKAYGEVELNDVELEKPIGRISEQFDSNNNIPVFLIKGIPKEKAFAFGNNSFFFTKFIYVPFPKERIVAGALSFIYKAPLEEFKFDNKEGTSYRTIKYNGKKIKVKLETKIKELGKFDYNVKVKADWVENGESKSHLWEVHAIMTSGEILNDKGDDFTHLIKISEARREELRNKIYIVGDILRISSWIAWYINICITLFVFILIMILWDRFKRISIKIGKTKTIILLLALSILLTVAWFLVCNQILDYEKIISVHHYDIFNY